MRWPDQCALQSRKWQLIGKSQWCCSANCSHPIARVNVQLDPRYAASKHTTAPINLTRPLPRKYSPDGATRAIWGDKAAMQPFAKLLWTLFVA